jgi:NitT/TauT family transport system substrate-binding protein
MFSRREFILTSVIAAPAVRALDFDALPVKLIIDEGQELTFAFMQAAINEGYFRNVALDVIIEQKGNAEGLSFPFTDFNAYLKNSPTDSKAIYAFSDLLSAALIVRKSRGITLNLASLHDKIIGAPAGISAVTYFPYFAKQNNIAVDKLKFEMIGRNLREPMLASGEVDAILGSPALLIPSLKFKNVPLEDIITLNYADLGCPLFGNALIAHDKTIKDQPDVLKRLLSGISKAMAAFSLNARPVSWVLTRKNEGLNPELVLEQMIYYLSESIFTPFIKAQGLGRFDKQRLSLIKALLEIKGEDIRLNEEFLP